MIVMEWYWSTTQNYDLLLRCVILAPQGPSSYHGVPLNTPPLYPNFKYLTNIPTTLLFIQNLIFIYRYPLNNIQNMKLKIYVVIQRSKHFINLLWYNDTINSKNIIFSQKCGFVTT